MDLVGLAQDRKIAEHAGGGIAVAGRKQDGHVRADFAQAMGQRARECWSDAWVVVGGLLENVVTRGEAVLFAEMLIPIVRRGQLEDAWWNYSYSPAFNDDGAVAGVLAG